MNFRATMARRALRLCLLAAVALAPAAEAQAPAPTPPASFSDLMAAVERGDSKAVDNDLADEALLTRISAVGELPDVYLAVGEAETLSFQVRDHAYKSALHTLQQSLGAAESDVEKAVIFGQDRRATVDYVALIDARRAAALGALPPPGATDALRTWISDVQALSDARARVVGELGNYTQACPAGSSCQSALGGFVQALAQEQQETTLSQAYRAISRALNNENDAHRLYDEDRRSHGQFHAYGAAASAFRRAASDYQNAASLLATASPGSTSAAARLQAYAQRAGAAAVDADAAAARLGPDHGEPLSRAVSLGAHRSPAALAALAVDANVQLAELLLQSGQQRAPLSSYQATCWAGGGRKMPASARLPLFFATSRKPLPQAQWNTLKETYFGPERESLAGAAVALNYGRAVVSVPCHHKIGEVERPPTIMSIELRDHDPAQDFVLEPPALYAGKAPWLRDVAAQMAHASRRELLLYVHGYNNTFADAAYRSAQLNADLGIDGATVFYAWASKANLLKYPADRAIAESDAEAAALGQVLRDLQRVGAKRVYLVAHSMGNRLATHALQVLARQPGGPVLKIDQVVFASADIEQAEFEQRWAEARRLVGSATLYASQHDRAVEVAKLVENHERRMGDARPTPIAEPGITSIDTTLVSEGAVGHTDFASSAILDMKAMLWAGAPPARRCLLRNIPLGRASYWRVEASAEGSCLWDRLADALELARLEGSAAAASRWITAELETFDAPRRARTAAYAAEVKAILAALR